MIAYLDASAIAKLFLDEPGSAEMRELWESGVRTSTSEITVTELACALGAAARAGRLPAEHPSAALLDGTFLSQRADLVHVDTGVVRSAAVAGVRHGLRALDAIHVASALVLRDADPTLVSWHRGQRRAAHAEGLRVYP